MSKYVKTITHTHAHTRALQMLIVHIMTSYSAASRHISLFAVSPLCCCTAQSAGQAVPSPSCVTNSSNTITTGQAVGSGTCVATAATQRYIYVLQQPSKCVHETGEVLDVPKEGNAHILKVEEKSQCDSSTLKTKRLRSFDTSGPTHPSTQRRVTDEPPSPLSATNLWEHQISNPPKYLYVICAKIFRFSH